MTDAWVVIRGSKGAREGVPVGPRKHSESAAVLVFLEEQGKNAKWWATQNLYTVTKVRR